MKSSLLSLLLFFLFSSLLSSPTHQTFSIIDGTQLIQETCNRSAQSDPQLSYDFCVASLEADPRSNSADLQELGVISVELAIMNATNLVSHINYLMENETFDPFMRSRLRSCLDLYSDAIPTLVDSRCAFQSEHYDDANIWVSAAMEAGSTCEDGFSEERGHVSPLSKQNGEFFQLGAIALAITRLLARFFL